MTSCACFCDVGDCGSDVYDAIWRTARKPHRCCECGATIEIGARYEYASVCYDGGWGHAKTCLLCTRIRNDLCPRGMCHGELWQTIYDCLGFDYVTGEDKPEMTPFAWSLDVDPAERRNE